MSNELEKTAQAADMKLDVDVRLIEPRGNLMGFANVTANDCLRIDDFKVLQGEKGLFVGMPSKATQGRDGKTAYYDTVRPVTKEFRAALTEAVVTAYTVEVEKLQSRAASLAKPSISQQLAEGTKQAAKENIFFRFGVNLFPPDREQPFRTDNHHRDQQHAEDDHTVIFQITEQFRDAFDDKRADERAGDGTHAADDDDRQGVDRDHENEIAGADVGIS